MRTNKTKGEKIPNKWKQEMAEIEEELYQLSSFVRHTPPGQLQSKWDKISELESRKLQIILESKFEVGFNMLCPRCGLAGHSPEDYEKCVSKL